MEQTAIYFFILGSYKVSETKSAAIRLTTTSAFKFLLSKYMNDRLHKKTMHEIIRKKLAKNTDNFLGKLSVYGSLRAR